MKTTMEELINKSTIPTNNRGAVNSIELPDKNMAMKIISTAYTVLIFAMRKR